MKIPAVLQALLSATKQNQTQLAQTLEVSFPTVNSWINERSIPRKKQQQKILNLYEYYFGVQTITAIDLTSSLQKVETYRRKYPDPYQWISSRPDLQDEFLLQLTYNTNSIEGSTMTVPETQAVLFSQKNLTHKSLIEQLEVTNHKAAYEYFWRSVGTSFFTESMLLCLHQKLMNGIQGDAGHYRFHPVRIVGSYVPTANFQRIPQKITEFLSRLNDQSSANIYQQLAQCHAVFEQIHPFSDGNGRIGRLLLHWQALRLGLPPVLIETNRKQAYYRYLQRAQLEDDFQPLTGFILESLLKAYEILDA